MAAAKKSKKTSPKPTPPARKKRLIVDVPEDVHRALKVRAASEGLSIREFVLALLKEKGIGR
jgi:predicted HicB family RNase H-like nuclease